MLLSKLAFTVFSVFLGLPFAAAQLKGNESSVHSRGLCQQPDSRLGFLSLQLQTVGDDRRTQKSRYDSNESMSIKIMATNRDTHEIAFGIEEEFINYSPQLFKAGVQLEYSKQMRKRIADYKPAHWRSFVGTRLPANQQSLLGVLQLSNWYGKLEPGIYEIRVRFRISRDGPWAESDTVMFEVAPEGF